MFLDCMFVAADLRFTKESNNSSTLSFFKSLCEQYDHRIIQGWSQILLGAQLNFSVH